MGQTTPGEIHTETRGNIHQTCQQRMELGERASEAMYEDKQWNGSWLRRQLISLRMWLVEGSDGRISTDRDSIRLQTGVSAQQSRIGSFCV